MSQQQYGNYYDPGGVRNCWVSCLHWIEERTKRILKRCVSTLSHALQHCRPRRKCNAPCWLRKGFSCGQLLRCQPSATKEAAAPSTSWDRRLRRASALRVGGGFFFVFFRDVVDTGFGALFLGNRSGRIGEGIVTVAGLREGNNFTDGVSAG